MFRSFPLPCCTSKVTAEQIKSHQQGNKEKHANWQKGLAHLMMADDCETFWPFIYFFLCLSCLLTSHTLPKQMHKSMASSTNAAHECSSFFLNGIDCTLHIGIMKRHNSHKRFCFYRCLLYISSLATKEDTEVAESSRNVFLLFSILRRTRGT